MVIYPLFKGLSKFLIRRNFKTVHIDGNFQDNGNPIFVITNHISWWDGFWLMYLNLKILHRKYHFMMLEKQLKKHWYFRYSGAFSVKKKSRSIIESLHFTEELLESKANMVFMFPQGKIHSLYNDNIKFEQGAQRIINHIDDKVQVLFVADFVDYFETSKPNLYINIRQYSAKDLKGKLAEQKYNEFYSEALNQQKEKHV